MAARDGDIPIGRDTAVRFLPWLVAFMVYLAALALTCAMVMHKMVERWDQGLAGRVTVQVPPPASNSPDAVARQIELALEILGETPGVSHAEAIDRADMAELLEPWLGPSAMDQGLPLPSLIAVTLDDPELVDVQALNARLEGIAPGVLVDDHQRWLGRLLVLARTIETVAVFVVLAVGLAAVGTIVFVTRTGLAIHRNVIELLHLIGAQDPYVARQFERHALWLGLRGGVIGLALAAATVVLIGYLVQSSQTGLLPSLSFAVWEWLALAVLPLLTAMIAMVTARWTVMRNLSRLP